LFHTATSNACNSDRYVCFEASGHEYTGTIWPGVGNQTSGGPALATTRILLGFDRLITAHLVLGAKLGFALGGAPEAFNGDKFLPVHVELRGAYFFGADPFSTAGFRPFVALALGVAEVDSKIAIEYYVDEAAYNAGQKSTVDGWRKTGKSFIGPSLGTHFALSNTSAITAEARLQLMLGTTALAPAIAVGYAQGI
jgi:hypothetical protein